jgi:hypothetical protein
MACIRESPRIKGIPMKNLNIALAALIGLLGIDAATASDNIANENEDHYIKIKTEYQKNKNAKNPYNMPGTNFKARVDEAVNIKVFGICGFGAALHGTPEAKTKMASEDCTDVLAKLDKIVKACVVATTNVGCDIALDILDAKTKVKTQPGFMSPRRSPGAKLSTLVIGSKGRGPQSQSATGPSTGQIPSTARTGPNSNN